MLLFYTHSANTCRFLKKQINKICIKGDLTVNGLLQTDALSILEFNTLLKGTLAVL